MLTVILFLLCIILTVLIGRNILFLLCGFSKENNGSFGETIGLSYMFGLGGITIQMFLMGVSNIAYTKINILIPWLFIGIITVLVLLRKNYFSKNPVRHIKEREKFSRLEILLFSFISFQAVYNFLRAIAKPIESYDSVAIYGLKAKMIYLSGALDGSFFKSLISNFHGAHADYPLFTPLSEVWIYTFLGNFNDLIVKAIFPIFYIAFLLVFYSILKKVTKNRTVSLLFTFFLASIKQFSDYSTIGYADMQLGAFFMIGFSYLYLWFSRKDRTDFLGISLIALILSFWSKNEGLLLSLIALLVFFLYMCVHIKKTTKRDLFYFLFYTGVTLFMVIFWNIFKKHHGLINDDFNLSMVSVKGLIGNLNKIPVMLYEYQKQFFGLKKWNLVWVLFFFLLFKEFKNIFSKNIAYVTMVFILSTIGYSLIYMFSIVEIRFFLRTTASRFLLHILPVTLLWIALIAYDRKLLIDFK